jgi:selenocysteine lyase/cysteine desulfurase
MDNRYAEAIAELENGVHAALETYSNVHRGSGHFSLVTTQLFEKAREIVLDYLELNKSRYVVIFCSPMREKVLKDSIKSNDHKSISSQDIGLPLGVRVFAVNKKDLPHGNPFHSGGGTTKLVSRDWIIWADAPDRFEAGTPAVVNIIAFVKALLITKKYGKDIFLNHESDNRDTADILYHDEFEEYSGSELLRKLRGTMFGHEVQVPTLYGLSSYINLDNAASTPSLAPVWDTFRMTLRQPPEIQKQIVNEVRSICFDFLGAPADIYDIIFTSNTTEAINLAAEGLPNESEKNSEPVILNTLLEHNSNDLPWRAVRDHSLIRLQIDAEGFIDLKELESVLHAFNKAEMHGRKRITLVAISGASNVLGSFNDLAEVSRIVHNYNARLLVDAAQLVAHRKVEIGNYGIDYFVFCAHKVYAPFGTGVLIARKGALDFSDGERELIRSSGEENTGGIAALGKSLVLLKRIGMEKIREEEKALTQKALEGLSAIRGLKIYGVKDPDSPRFSHKGGVIPFFMKGKMPYRIARELAGQGGIGIRNGCHCAHILVKHLLNVPQSLEKFQWVIAHLVPGVVFPGLARISIGIGNTPDDIDKFLSVLKVISRPELIEPEKATGTKSVREFRKLLKEFVNKAVQRVYYQ